MSIPARLHFCWIGDRLSWACVFAILSAAERGEMAEIVLHHTDPLAGGAELRALAGAPCVRVSRLDAPALLRRTGRLLGLGDRLAERYATLDRPAMRADMLRAAILYLEGGVYLDLDTITVASLRPLLDAGVFVGSERIVWPDRVRRSRSPWVWARHLALDVLRKMLSALPHGWALFRHVERFYALNANNAVIGAVRHAPLLADMLCHMAAEGAAGGTHARSRTALGPDLLHAAIARQAGRDLVIHPPSAFYPLPPEISRHWFRIGPRPRLARVLSADTRVVHWYASVRNQNAVARITPDYVRRHRHCQLYSALVCACVHALQLEEHMLYGSRHAIAVES